MTELIGVYQRGQEFACSKKVSKFCLRHPWYREVSKM